MNLLVMRENNYVDLHHCTYQLGYSYAVAVLLLPLHSGPELSEVKKNLTLYVFDFLNKQQHIFTSHVVLYFMLSQYSWEMFYK